MSERYIVELEFKRIGDLGIEQLSGRLTKSTNKLDEFKRGWGELRGSVAPLGAAFDGVMRSAARVATIGASMGGAAIVAGATYGVVNLNNELEKATIGLGVIFNASGMASSVPKGLERAQQVVAQMRVDAQKLPGEFSELQTIFSTAATPAFRSGATIDQLRELSAKAMVAGKTNLMDMGMVAREFTLLLEGRAGSHNTFGGKMGLTGTHAQKFNALESDKRFAELSRLLSKYESGLTMFESSFDAQSTTLVDSLKDFGRGATAPLFESVKQTMAEANGWIATHKGELNEYATSIGYAIRDGFVEAKGLVMEWGPRVLHFAEGAQIKFHEIWYDAQKIAESFGITSDAIRDALADPSGTIDKMLELGKIYLALKGAGLMVGAGQAAFGAASGAGSILNSVGLLSGGAVVGKAVGAAATGEAAGGSALALAGAGAAFVAALGGVSLAVWQYAELTNDIHHEYALNAQAKADASMREIQQMVKEGYSEEMIQQRRNAMHDQYIASGQNLAANILDTALAAAEAAGQLRTIAQTTLGGRGNNGPFGNDDWSKPMPYAFDPASINHRAKAVAEPERSADASKHKSKGGGGGIQKVEIVVTSNQHPSRIARGVVGLLGQLMRNPGASPDVTNYSALEDD